jgi:hypothetical protein
MQGEESGVARQRTCSAQTCAKLQVALSPLYAPALLQGPHASLAVRLSQRDPGRTFVLVRWQLLVSFGTPQHSAQSQCVQL